VAPEGRISIGPIGVVRSAFSELAGMPLQSIAAREVEGTVEILPALAPGLRDLEGFSHIHLLTWLHRAPRDGTLELVPFLDEEPRGVFATRSPSRPNPIGSPSSRCSQSRARACASPGSTCSTGRPCST